MNPDVSSASAPELLLAPLSAQTPGKDISTESASPGTAKDQPGKDTTSARAATRQYPENEEPEMLLEPDLPSDGRDEKGEAMIRDLPQRPELSEPPSQPGPSSIKP
ncbi:MAG: hypothetical protein WAW46_14420 [Polaromonas sp.]